MKYFRIDDAVSHKIIVRDYNVTLDKKKSYSSRELTNLLGFKNTRKFLNSSTRFLHFVPAPNPKTVNPISDSDGYSIYGRHIPNGFTEADYLALVESDELKALKKKFKLDSMTLVFTAPNHRPTTINLEYNK